MAVATLVPIEEYLSASWDPDREYAGELDHRLFARHDLFGAPEARASHVRRIAGSSAGQPISHSGRALAVRGARPPGRFLRQPRISSSRSSPAKTGRAISMTESRTYLEFGVGNIPGVIRGVFAWRFARARAAGFAGTQSRHRTARFRFRWPGYSQTCRRLQKSNDEFLRTEFRVPRHAGLMAPRLKRNWPSADWLRPMRARKRIWLS